MQRPILLLISLMLLNGALFSQVLDPSLYRTYDGSQNNISNPEWGQAGTNLLRLVPATYADSISSPTGQDRTNPRVISNSLFAQPELISDPLQLSDFCWVWGQFLDHDIGLTPDGSENASIPVPAGDPFFDPLGFGNVMIPMQRNLFDPSTGTDPNNPREHPNEITAYIDGSAVYGSDQEAADWLRSFEGGLLKTSNNNMLPFNTVDGLFTGEIDPSAPHMDIVGNFEKFYVAGDPRANENPLLLSFHTLFVREHNRQCERLARINPEWTDEELYQYARKIVGGLIQKIVYQEWLPAIGVILDEYEGYQNDVNAQLANEFTAAAFRMGHTLLNSIILRLDDQGNEIPQGHLGLRDAFFNPFVILETGDIDPFFKGMATQTQQNFDPRIVDDVRNFLFGPPGAGGLDLASININRGRERGLPDFNTMRAALGLEPYQFFQQINSNAVVFTKLLSLYLNTDNIDLWVGLLSERAQPGSLFGQTLVTILKQQFENLRDGDRFYYPIDPLLTLEDIEYIDQTSLRDIIMYNTGIFLMQDNVFLSKPHEEICETMTLGIRGSVKRSDGVKVQNVDLSLDMTAGNTALVVDENGDYDFGAQLACGLGQLTASRDDEPRNGISTFDIILFQKHLLNVELLDSPYKIIAGDLDDNGNLSTLDLIRLRRLILGIDSVYQFVPSWRFVPAAYEFEDPSFPLDEDWPEILEFTDFNILDFNKGFIAVKMGDANYSANPGFQSEEESETVALQLAINDQAVQVGDQIQIPIGLVPNQELMGYQFALEFSGLNIRSVETSTTLNSDHYAILDNHELRLSWHDLSPEPDEDSYLIIEAVVEEAGQLSDMISLGANLEAESYITTGQIANLDLDFSNSSAGASWGEAYPNPFRETVWLPFELSTDDQVQLDVYDALGRLIFTDQRQFGAGAQQWQLSATQLNNSAGWLHYHISSSNSTSGGKLLLSE